MKAYPKLAVVIDEEPHFSEIMASALRIKGFHVVQFFEATGAFNSMISDPEEFGKALMFIDMALEPGDDDEMFSLENTDRFMTTGLVLATKIISEGFIKTHRQGNLVLYSAHQKGQYWHKIDKFCEKFGARKWQKRADAELQEIFDLADGYVS